MLERRGTWAWSAGGSAASCRWLGWRQRRVRSVIVPNTLCLPSPSQSFLQYLVDKTMIKQESLTSNQNGKSAGLQHSISNDMNTCGHFLSTWCGAPGGRRGRSRRGRSRRRRGRTRRRAWPPTPSRPTLTQTWPEGPAPGRGRGDAGIAEVGLAAALPNRLVGTSRHHSLSLASTRINQRARQPITTKVPTPPAPAPRSQSGPTCWDTPSRRQSTWRAPASRPCPSAGARRSAGGAAPWCGGTCH